MNVMVIRGWLIENFDNLFAVIKIILGITFNALVNNKSSNIIAFRNRGDIAQMYKGHTDHWITDYRLKKTIRSFGITLFLDL